MSDDIKFIDLDTQYKLIKSDLDNRLARIFEHKQFILGPEVSELEYKLKEYTNSKYCITCSNGTDALLMSLMAFGIKPGDKVLTTTFSFIATKDAIIRSGAIPVFVDVDMHFNINIKNLKKAISNNKVKALISVDLFGMPVCYNEIKKITKDNNIIFISDGAQSFGAKYDNKHCAILPDVYTTSFHPTKALGCYGDGGAIFTQDPNIADKLLSIRVHGKVNNNYELLGINGRLDTIQAAVLLSKFNIFDKELLERKAIANYYKKNLNRVFRKQAITLRSNPSYSQFPILVKNRDLVREKLKRAGIPTMIYYPYMLGKGTMAKLLSELILNIPIHPYLSDIQKQRIIQYVNRTSE